MPSSCRFAAPDAASPAARAAARLPEWNLADLYAGVESDALKSDLAAVEKAEIAVLEKYLPAAMSAEEVVKLVESVIAETGATAKKEMGAVMKVLQERAGGRVDNRTLSTEVSKRLA